MEPHIDDSIRAIEEVKVDAGELVEPLDAERFNWRAGDGRWSVGQCLQHLNIFGNGTIVPKIDEMLQEAQTRGLHGNGSIRPGWFGRWIIGVFDAPPGRKVRTAPGFRPPSELDKREVVSSFDDLQDRLIERARAARQLDLKALKRRLPMPVWLNLGEWFAFAVAHERRHLWQARRVVEHAGFPSAEGAVRGASAG